MNRFSNNLISLIMAILHILPVCATDMDSMRLEVGPFCSSEPYGITMLVDRTVSFVISPLPDKGKTLWSESDEATLPYPDCASDGSYTQIKMKQNGHPVTLTYGKLNDWEVGVMLNSPDSMTFELRCIQPFSACKNSYWKELNFLEGYGYGYNHTRGLTVSFRAESQPSFIKIDANYSHEARMWCKVTPYTPTVLILSVRGKAKTEFDNVPYILAEAKNRYYRSRLSSSGYWGDFAGAIQQVLSASRIFSSLDHRIFHTIGRGWWMAYQKNFTQNDDLMPVFEWDAFFHLNMASLSDPEVAKESARSVLSMQQPDGMIPSFSHWQVGGEFATPERSFPPVGSLCVWKMYEHQADTAFLEEVYPNLVEWHDWFPKNRTHNGSSLLCWGSARGEYDDASLETGWDDTPSFGDGKMEGSLINQYCVDLSSLWAADAQYLCNIALVLGHTEDAVRFRKEYEKIITEINEKLWNDSLGIYCNRAWKDNPDGTPHFQTSLSPMNFYPLICGSPTPDRADRMLKILHDYKTFWGDWIVPTLAYNDSLAIIGGYWRGKIWAPANYLLWQGLLRYDNSKNLRHFVERSVKLFMKNWETPEKICGENYRTNGYVGDCPHYTWGALLALIGVESLVEVGNDLHPVPRQLGIKDHIKINNIPIAGRLYNIENNKGKTVITKIP